MVAPQVEEMQEQTRASGARRPVLVLVETGGGQPAPRRKRSRRAAKRVGERIMMLAAFCVIGLFLLCSGVSWLWRSATAANPIGMVDAAPVINVTVMPGDTLWKYASRYGSPDTYVLDRVDTIARANHLDDNAALSPGQTLRIAVTNPIEVAKIERARQFHLASVPH